MKTLQPTFHVDNKVTGTNRERLMPAVINGTRDVMALMSAVTVAAIMVFTGIWASGLDATELVGAASWGLGLIFLGNAVDNNQPLGLLHFVSGLAMMILAWLQAAVSADFTIGSALVLAAWVSVAVFRKLR